MYKAPGLSYVQYVLFPNDSYAPSLLSSSTVPLSGDHRIPLTRRDIQHVSSRSHINDLRPNTGNDVDIFLEMPLNTNDCLGR